VQIAGPGGGSAEEWDRRLPVNLLFTNSG